MRLNFYFPVIQAISPHISFAFKFMTTISSGHAQCFVWEFITWENEWHKRNEQKCHECTPATSGLFNSLIFNPPHHFQGSISLICREGTKGWNARKQKTQINSIVVHQNATPRAQLTQLTLKHCTLWILFVFSHTLDKWPIILQSPWTFI